MKIDDNKSEIINNFIKSTQEFEQNLQDIFETIEGSTKEEAVEINQYLEKENLIFEDIQENIQTIEITLFEKIVG